MLLPRIQRWLLSSASSRAILALALVSALVPAGMSAQSSDANQAVPQTPEAQPATPAQGDSTPTGNYQDPLEAPIPKPAGQFPSETKPQGEPASAIPSLPPYDFEQATAAEDNLGSTYIPVDSPLYPMALRLYSMGYLNTAFISMRPWTRRSLLHMLQATQTNVVDGGNDEAIALVARMKAYLADEAPDTTNPRGAVYGIHSVYTRLMGITGNNLRDSYHLGQTIVNDYGRPYAEGFNNVTGISSVNEWGRFSLFVRGEYQHAPSRPSYSYALANQLTCTDLIACPMKPDFIQDTIPYGNTQGVDTFALQEANASVLLLHNEISFGKSDAWLGPGQGGAMAWSNNAQDIYSFRINRVEPLHIPLLSDVLGPVRYDFFVGSLKGHTVPNDPWIHSEMFSFRPTSNFEFAFQRSVIWGGKGPAAPRHEPITLHTFLKSFFDISDTTPAEKYSRNDPGARFSDFSFSWRLPFLRHYVTLYTDSIVHDDVTPISAPRRAAYRPGVYISQFPGLPKLDFRIEGVSTDTSTLRSLKGTFIYYEIVQQQGYTNKGMILGDWIGREAKGGQAWLTWHLSPDEFIQLEYLNKKTPKDFVAGGTTQNQIRVEAVKNLTHNLQLDAWLQYEKWKAPVPASDPNTPWTASGPDLYHPNAQNDTTIAAQFTWYPKLHHASTLNGRP